VGLAVELGYQYGSRNGFQRAVISLVQLKPVSALLRLILPPIDRAILRMSNGNGTASVWLAALPPLWLTTVGAKSGLERTTPLYGIPADGNLAVFGTSFGQEHTPGWVYNLEANPLCTVSYGGQSRPVVARPASEAEEPALWEAAADIYAGYLNYGDWASHRRIRVFVLELA